MDYFKGEGINSVTIVLVNLIHRTREGKLSGFKHRRDEFSHWKKNRRGIYPAVDATMLLGGDRVFDNSSVANVNGGVYVRMMDGKSDDEDDHLLRKSSIMDRENCDKDMSVSGPRTDGGDFGSNVNNQFSDTKDISIVNNDSLDSVSINMTPGTNEVIGNSAQPDTVGGTDNVMIGNSEEMPNDHNVAINNDIHIFDRNPQSILICQLIIFLAWVSLFSVVLWNYSQSWNLECDKLNKAWSLVWIIRWLVQILNNITITIYRMKNRNPPSLSYKFLRIIYYFGFIWFIFGIDVIFTRHSCPQATVAHSTSKVMFWFTLVYYIPLFFYLLLLLCLPFIIIVFVRFAVPVADRQPTPQNIIDRLEVKTYKEIVEALSRQYNVSEKTNTIKSHIAKLPFGGVFLSTNNNGANEPSGSSSSNNGSESERLRSSDLEANIGPNERQQKETILINNSCPICVMDLDQDDEILIMPCDTRHFFHKACVTDWLQTSQVCPICRDNVVNRVTGNTEATGRTS